MRGAGVTVWTEADQAELEVLALALVDAVAEHRPGCDVCGAGSPPCPQIRRAIEVVVDWRERRLRLSRAEYLRSGQALVDFGARCGFTPDEVAALRAKWLLEEAIE